MTDQELKLELLKVAKAQNPHEMGNSPLEMAKAYYHWINDNVTFEEENMNPPGYEGTLRIRHQIQSIIKTAQSEIFSLSMKESHYTEQPHSKMVKTVAEENKIYKNAFNKLLEL